MRFFVKILLVLFTSACLALCVSYFIYRDILLRKTTSFLAGKALGDTGLDISVGAVSILFPDTIRLKNIVIYNKTLPGEILAKIDDLRINTDLFDILMNRPLENLIHASGIKKDNISCDVILKLYHDPDGAAKRIFYPGIISAIAVIDGKLSAGNLEFKKINGFLDFKDRSVDKAKIAGLYGQKDVILTLDKPSEANNKYKLSLSSENILLTAAVMRVNNRTFLIDTVTGDIYGLALSLSGHLRGYGTSDMELALGGSADMDLAGLKDIPGAYGKMAGFLEPSGIIMADINLSAGGTRFEKQDIRASLRSDLIEVNDIEFRMVSAEMSVKDTRLVIPRIAADFYNGKISGELDLALGRKGLPYTLSVYMNDMYLDELIGDITEKYPPVYGTVFSKLYLVGNASDAASAEGTLEIEISDADLGPMPVFAPLLGNIYNILSGAIIAPENRVDITQAYAEFLIKDGKIETRNATLWGDNIAVLGQGYMDFSGNLDFALENKFLESAPSVIPNWQSSLRDSLIRFGKALGNARLKGTISKPKWEFDYFPKK